MVRLDSSPPVQRGFARRAAVVSFLLLFVIDASVAVSLAAASGAAAQDRQSWPETSAYVGVVIPYHRFEGTTHRSENGRPTIDGDVSYPATTGIGAVLGTSKRVLGVELSFTRAAADVSFSNATSAHKGRATWNQLNLDFRVSLTGNLLIRPYLLAGAGLFWMVPDKGVDFRQTPLWNGEIDALGTNLGAGVEVRPAKAFSVAGSVVYRSFSGTTTYNPIRSTHAPITYSMSGNGVSFQMSVRFHIK